MQEKEEEMEQRTGKLLRENQQLQENCTSLLQQKSDAQAELQREQVQMPARGELGHERIALALNQFYFVFAFDLSVLGRRKAEGVTSQKPKEQDLLGDGDIKARSYKATCR